MSVRSPFSVALVVPLQGSEGMYGPSCELCAQLAAEEINAQGGLLGRELRFVTVDGAARPAIVAAEVDALVAAGAVDAVVGWHISAVRVLLAPRLALRVPYIYTALYEGGERHPGVYLTGETPGAQIFPALRWMAHEVGVRRWCIVGNDYVWPRLSAAASRRFAPACGADICDEIFVGLGTTDYVDALTRIERGRCDGVLMFLVGADAVAFNRQFAERGLDAGHVRLTPLMDENMLLASGPANVARLYTSSGYFQSLPTAENLEFGAKYERRFGVEAPVLNSLGESCYEGMQLLAALVRQAGSADARSICARAENTRYSGPRGLLRLHDGHVLQRMYLARPDGLDYDIICSL